MSCRSSRDKMKMYFIQDGQPVEIKRVEIKGSKTKPVIDWI